jgi:acetylglutamate kinase
VDKLYVIKIGGNVIDDETALSNFLRQFASINSRKILVHGGGKMANRLADQLNVKQQMIDGRRITDSETLNIVTMVYAGLINKNIVARLQSMECNAIGVTGADAGLMVAHKRIHPEIDYGFVGDVDAVNKVTLKALIDLPLTIVFAPITCDQQGQLLNTNADTIAQELAQSLCADYNTTLVYSFEKPGVLLDINDESSVIRVMNRVYYQELKNPVEGESRIFAGMIPKLDNAFAAINNGVKQVIIGKADQLQELIAGSAGTTIVNE